MADQTGNVSGVTLLITGIVRFKERHITPVNQFDTRAKTVVKGRGKKIIPCTVIGLCIKHSIRKVFPQLQVGAICLLNSIGAVYYYTCTSIF